MLRIGTRVPIQLIDSRYSLDVSVSSISDRGSIVELWLRLRLAVIFILLWFQDAREKNYPCLQHPSHMIVLASGHWDKLGLKSRVSV